MSDVQNVTPEIIDVPEVISGADQWLAEQRAKVSSIAEEYKPHQITSGQDYRDSKRARTSARKAIKEVEDARKQQVGAIKSAVKDFETQVRDLLEPLSNVDADYKAALTDWENLVIDSRTQSIAAWYEDEFHDVSSVIPFKTLWDRFSAEGKWGLYGTNEVAIRDDVARRVGEIEQDLSTLDSAPYADEDKANVKAEYVRTLDLSTALRNADEARKAREALKRAAEERKKREEEAAEYERQLRLADEQAAREQAEKEERERQQRLADAEAARQRRIDTGQEAPAAAANVQTASYAGAPKTLVFEVTVPENVVGEFIAAMKSVNGVHGKKIGVR
jgi:membrane protein involved in colicin uptake